MSTSTLFPYVKGTVLRNPTNSTRYYGMFNNDLGITIPGVPASATDPSNEVTIPYDVWNPQGAWAYRRDEYNKLLTDLIESGNLEILATQIPIYFDDTNDGGTVLSVDNHIVTASDAITTSGSGSGIGSSGSGSGSGSGSEGSGSEGSGSEGSGSGSGSGSEGSGG